MITSLMLFLYSTGQILFYVIISIICVVYFNKATYEMTVNPNLRVNSTPLSRWWTATSSSPDIASIPASHASWHHKTVAPPSRQRVRCWRACTAQRRRRKTRPSWWTTCWTPSCCTAPTRTASTSHPSASRTGKSHTRSHDVSASRIGLIDWLIN